MLRIGSKRIWQITSVKGDLPNRTSSQGGNSSDIRTLVRPNPRLVNRALLSGSCRTSLLTDYWIGGMDATKSVDFATKLIQEFR